MVAVQCMIYISLLTKVFVVFSYNCIKIISFYYLQLLSGKINGYRLLNKVTSERKKTQNSLLCAC